MKEEKKSEMTTIRIPYYRPPVISKEKYFDLLNEVFDSGIFTNNGPKVSLLEKRIAEIHEYRFCAIVTNATVGLQLLYKTLGLKRKIITTPFTFVATSSAMVWEGLTPYFVDITEDNLTIDAQEVDKNICPNTSAVVGVNVFGNSCDYEKIGWLCSKFELHEIYDSAHSFGITDKKSARAIEVLSFHSTKVFSTVEGGAILTNDQNLYEKLVKTRNFGFAGMDHVTDIGINAKMDELRGAYGLYQLGVLPNIKEKLKLIHGEYNREFRQIRGIQYIGSTKVNSNFHYYPIRVTEESGISRDQLWAYLWAIGIQTRRYFYPLISQFSPYSNYQGNTPISKKAAEEVLCLPSFFGLTSDMIQEVVINIQKCLQLDKVTIQSVIEKNIKEDFFYPVAVAIKNKEKFGY